MTNQVGLAQFAKELGYAAGIGAARIASSVTAAGNLQAKTGIVGPQMPGPALRSVMAAYSGDALRSTNTADPSQLPAIAAHMAADALRQGAQLLSGGRP